MHAQTHARAHIYAARTHAHPCTHARTRTLTHARTNTYAYTQTPLNTHTRIHVRHTYGTDVAAGGVYEYRYTHCSELLLVSVGHAK